MGLEKITNEVLNEKQYLNTSKRLSNVTASIFMDDDEFYDLISTPGIRKLYLIDNSEIYDTEYFTELYIKLRMVEKLGKKIEVEYNIKNRDVFNNTRILFLNINQYIRSNRYRYSLKEYLDEEDILSDLVRNVKGTPYEMFNEIYDIARNYIPEKNFYSSITNRLIDDGDCLLNIGYSYLLVELLGRVGITSSLHKEDDSINTFPFKKERKNKPVCLDRHSLVIVNLVDPKYNIDGLFLSDIAEPSKKLFNFDEKENSEKIDRILNNHDSNEFYESIYSILEDIEKDNSDIKSKEIKEKWIYEEFMSFITKYICLLDRNEHNKLLEYINTPYRERNIDFYKKFIDEICKFTLSKTNKKYDVEKGKVI